MTKRSLLCALLLAAAPAAAYNAGEGGDRHTSTAIGGRDTFYKPQDVGHGTWNPGVELRLHVNKAYAAELSADFTRHPVEETTVKVLPIQASILGYFYPDANISPYLVAGIGWYQTKVLDASPHTTQRWGPHAGLGLSVLLGDRLSLQASYRWLWSQTYNVTDVGHPVGQNFSGRGHMLTLGLDLGL